MMFGLCAWTALLFWVVLFISSYVLMNLKMVKYHILHLQIHIIIMFLFIYFFGVKILVRCSTGMVSSSVLPISYKNFSVACLILVWYLKE